MRLKAVLKSEKRDMKLVGRVANHVNAVVAEVVAKGQCQSTGKASYILIDNGFEILLPCNRLTLVGADRIGDAFVDYVCTETQMDADCEVWV